MAHFAKIENGVVTQVIVVSNDDCKGPDGQELEAQGIAFCVAHFGGTWVQTSYNGSIRKNYAGVGYTYDSQRDAFIAPQPFSSWTLDEATCKWQAPVPYPDDGQRYRWDEANLQWVAL